ncbi:MarR family winged helix-turn-helix transcriptional regulator [Amycolatopsis sp. SID8362]|uniref:MarR family winged helix-turn-helix transcriptional regulator n=1 Tax=Amycolatopsis sp. SID8362 TaxID=2690346 RepID=UPI001367C991|nr:MarR family winged helix-turn-helix transcriptional regulator [Amycolatopsis sp. SID8362]NBH07901.1 MarR family transcriptional regulator [Amycolatopsis sp. SID8362]NED44596.1 winged helix-turn-helix transcriptional regulator [Amycolatopsis sp. SID8362]
MATRAERNATDPDLGVLSGRLLFAVQRELFATLAAQGFDDLKPRHGAVLAYLDDGGVRATELSRSSGQHKQIIGTLVDELEALGYVERRPDPRDRRAKLICPTGRGLAQMRAADAIMAAIQRRHEERVGPRDYQEFKRVLIDITEHQRGRS